MAKINSLKENHIFARAYVKGRSSSQRNIVVYAFPSSFLRKTEKTRRDITSVGITVSKKLGGAVERNRAKRLIREAYRQLIKSIGETENAVLTKPHIIVIVARGRITSRATKCAEVLSDMQKAFRALKIIAE